VAQSEVAAVELEVAEVMGQCGHGTNWGVDLLEQRMVC
jgi:hypothetical protein